jgi:hypothetical protein
MICAAASTTAARLLKLAKDARLHQPFLDGRNMLVKNLFRPVLRSAVNAREPGHLQQTSSHLELLFGDGARAFFVGFALLSRPSDHVLQPVGVLNDGVCSIQSRTSLLRGAEANAIVRVAPFA